MPTRTPIPQTEAEPESNALTRTIFWFLRNIGKILIYGPAMLLAATYGSAALGLGMLYALGLGLVTPFAMIMTNVLTNTILNYFFPQNPPRNADGISNPLLMTLGLSLATILGTGVAWTLGLVFLGPLIAKQSLLLATSVIEYFVPSVRTTRQTVNRVMQQALNQNLMNQIRDGQNNLALMTLENNTFSNDDLTRALEVAITANNTRLFSHIASMPALRNELHRDNNVLLISTCYQGRPLLTRILLANSHVRRNAHINNNEALRYACRQGHLGNVDALLQISRVRNNVTYNHNEALRLANENGNEAIAQRLRRISAVANYITPDDAGLTITLPAGAPIQANRDVLRDIANNRENSMGAPTPEQALLINAMRSRYRNQLANININNIMEEIREYIVSEYAKHPIKIKKRKIGLKTTAEQFRQLSDSEKLAHYNHTLHTAYRYLFLSPNPWIHPEAPFTNAVNGGRTAGVTSRRFDQELIATMWLTAKDKNLTTKEGFEERRSRKNEIINQLADMGRAHNRDDGPDDQGPDRPTCSVGERRLGQYLEILFVNDDPLTRPPLTRPLSKEIIMQKFKDELIIENDNNHTLFAKLRGLSRSELDAFEDGYLEWFEEGNIRGPENTREALLSPMDPSAQQVNDFIDVCCDYFGTERIRNNGAAITHLGAQYDSYEAFIRRLAETSLGEYGAEIMGKINLIKNPPVKNNKKDDDKKNTKKAKNKKPEPMTFSEKGKKASGKHTKKTEQRKSKTKTKSKPAIHKRPTARAR